MCEYCNQDPCIFTLVCEDCEAYCPYIELIDDVPQCCVCRIDISDEEKLHIINEFKDKHEYCREYCKAEDYI